VLLRVNDLRVSLGRAPAVPVLEGVCLDVAAGKTVGLVGESGSGKSQTALAILGLLPESATILGGSIEFDRRDLLRLDPAERRRLRGDRIAMIFQEPMTSLNPVLSVAAQIAEPLRLHRRLSASQARRRAIELLERVGIANAAARAGDPPHRFSGGMRQRVMIAMAIACRPALLIADEPTTALDVTVQAQIVALLAELQRETGMAVLFIAHDLALISQIADEVCVMYAGRIVESRPAAAFFASPLHPYSQALLRSVPLLEQQPARDGGHGRLPVIRGDVPRPGQRPAGCPFHPRCDHTGVDKSCSTAAPAQNPDRKEGAPSLRSGFCYSTGSERETPTAALATPMVSNMLS
jgi:oligopeptide/dipeptide ABC transporter ATP-binding protein